MTFSIGGRKGLSIAMGDGDDGYTAWEGDSVGTRGSISMGRGNDTIEAALSGSPDARLSITTGSGDDTVTELRASRTRRCDVSLGSGNDTLLELDLIGGDARVNGGSGTDTMGTVWVSPAYPATVVTRSFEDRTP